MDNLDTTLTGELKVSRLNKVLEAALAVKALSEPAFAGLDLRIARLIIWGVHHQRVDLVRGYCEARELFLDASEIHALAEMYRYIFRVDVPREEQPDCYLCSTALMPQFDLLCECYLRSVEGVYVTPDVASIEAQKRLNPRDWMYRLQATHLCKTCKQSFNVTLGDVAKQLAHGKPWVAPRWCRSCYKRPSSAPPKRRVSDKPRPLAAHHGFPVTGES